MKILPIRLGHVSAYLVSSKGTAMLVDTGLPGSSRSIKTSLAKAGVVADNLNLIVLTHAHYDHAGCAARLKEEFNAPLLCTEEESVHLEAGTTPFPHGLNPYARIITAAGRKLLGTRRQFDPCTADITIKDSLRLESWGIAGTALPFPGHSAGSLALILDSGEVFIGDGAFNIFPSSVVPPLADSTALLLESWKKLLSYDFHTIYPGHGRPFRREKLENSLTKLERIDRKINRKRTNT